jgi:hypothetical protein
MKTILHIAPQLPPAVDGVGDYCMFLTRAWRDSETSFSFAVLQGAEASRGIDPPPDVTQFSAGASSLRSLLDRSPATTVILHYVGYAYQPKGIPLWLPKALASWRGAHRDRVLVTMFHEMYARSGPLRSPFWVMPWARKIIRELVQVSDGWVTSCERYHDQLHKEFGADLSRGTLIPIGPNIPAAPTALQERAWPFGEGKKLRVAIFGLPRTRLTTLQQHQALLAALVKAEVVDTVVLIGKRDSSNKYAAKLGELQAAIEGQWLYEEDLPPSGVADALATCHIGLIANDSGTLTKSGVFAAMATNGVVCVVSDVGGVPLPAPFSECVLLNDNSDKTFSALVEELRDNNRMTARRRSTLRAAQTKLAWTEIAASWRTHLSKFTKRLKTQETPISRAITPPAVTEEVRA